MTDLLLVAIGLAMIIALVVLSGAVRDDPRGRARWETRFEREARELRRTDATGILTCRRCGASGSERAGVCPKCGAGL